MGPYDVSGYKGRGNANHSIGISGSNGLKEDTGEGHDSDKENNDLTVGAGGDTVFLMLTYSSSRM